MSRPSHNATKDVIVEAARTRNADLIVLGSHGYGRFRRMVLGSVAGAVVANAPCSVQVAREKHDLEGAAACLSGSSAVLRNMNGSTFDRSSSKRWYLPRRRTRAKDSLIAILVNHVENRAAPLNCRRCVKAFT
jgi:hypothetical protein